MQRYEWRFRLQKDEINLLTLRMLRKTRENSKMEFSFQFTTANFQWGSKIIFKRNTWRYEYCILTHFYLYLTPCNKTQTPSHTSHSYSFPCYKQLSWHLALFHLAFGSIKFGKCKDMGFVF